MTETCVKFETFRNFWMRGNKMTFPFSGEFKFKLLKAKREDDMTSSIIKNLNGGVCIWISLHFHSFFFVQQIAGKCILSNRKERRNMTLKYPGILNVICTLKLRGSFENYLQKKINLLGNFVKIIFSEVFILPWKNAHHLYFIFLIILVYKNSLFRIDLISFLTF